MRTRWVENKNMNQGDTNRRFKGAVDLIRRRCGKITESEEANRRRGKGFSTGGIGESQHQARSRGGARRGRDRKKGAQDDHIAKKKKRGLYNHCALHSPREYGKRRGEGVPWSWLSKVK